MMLEIKLLSVTLSPKSFELIYTWNTMKFHNFVHATGGSQTNSIKNAPQCTVDRLSSSHSHISYDFVKAKEDKMQAWQASSKSPKLLLSRNLKGNGTYPSYMGTGCATEWLTLRNFLVVFYAEWKSRFVWLQFKDIQKWPHFSLKFVYS